MCPFSSVASLRLQTRTVETPPTRHVRARSSKSLVDEDRRRTVIPNLHVNEKSQRNGENRTAHQGWRVNDSAVDCTNGNLDRVPHVQDHRSAKNQTEPA